MAAHEKEEGGSREPTEQMEIEPHVTGAYVALLSRGLLCIWHEKTRHARMQDPTEIPTLNPTRGYTRGWTDCYTSRYGCSTSKGIPRPQRVHTCIAAHYKKYDGWEKCKTQGEDGYKAYCW